MNCISSRHQGYAPYRREVPTAVRIGLGNDAKSITHILHRTLQNPSTDFSPFYYLFVNENLENGRCA